MDEWAEVLGDGSPVPGWEAWNIQVSVGTMPDGSIVATGLRIEPRDDYDGSKRDQHLTLAKLREFPIGFVTADARATIHGADNVDVQIEALRAQTATARREADSLRAQLKEQDAKQYQERIDAVGERLARLERVSYLYRAFNHLSVPSVRNELAKSMGVSVWSVDELLRAARAEGLLEPYHGKQGKHGKTEEPTKSKKS